MKLIGTTVVLFGLFFVTLYSGRGDVKSFEGVVQYARDLKPVERIQRVWLA